MTRPYQATYRYDANGNLTFLARNGQQTGADLRMDSLAYHYPAQNNRLTHVDDGVAAGTYEPDADDQNAANYAYDKTGNLIADVSEEVVRIEWNAAGKVTTVAKKETKESLYFEYGAMGSRVWKHAGGKESYYIRDAGGNVLAVYEFDTLETLSGEAGDNTGLHFVVGDLAEALDCPGCADATDSARVFAERYLHTGYYVPTEADIAELAADYPKQGPLVTLLANRLGYDAVEALVTRWHLLNTDTALFASSEWETREVWAAFARSEATVYGSSRLGTDHERKTVIRRKYRQVWNPLTESWFNTEAVSPDSSETPEADTVRLCYRAGYKQYALSNHLGNVLATVSDRVILEDTTGDDTADAHLADLLSAQDYYPFGMRMPGRAGSLYLNEASGEVEFVLDATAKAGTTYVELEMRYRYGFNGMEKDDELKGAGNSYDFGARIYDPRLGRWLSVDPMAEKYPYLSPFAGLANSPLVIIDPDGEDTDVYTTSGVYVTTIKDDLRNEIHFVTKSDANKILQEQRSLQEEKLRVEAERSDLLAMSADLFRMGYDDAAIYMLDLRLEKGQKLQAKSNNLVNSARANSQFFIGQNTMKALGEYYEKYTDGEGGVETGGLLYVYYAPGANKELQVHLCESCQESADTDDNDFNAYPIEGELGDYVKSRSGVETISESYEGYGKIAAILWHTHPPDPNSFSVEHSNDVKAGIGVAMSHRKMFSANQFGLIYGKQTNHPELQNGGIMLYKYNGARDVTPATKAPTHGETSAGHNPVYDKELNLVNREE